MQYTSFDKAFAIVHHCGWMAELAKCDIKSAFQRLPIYPEDFEFLFFSSRDQFYMDRALPMDCLISCSAFEKFGFFSEWALCKHTGLVKYSPFFMTSYFQGKWAWDSVGGVGMGLLEEFHCLVECKLIMNFKTIFPFPFPFCTPALFLYPVPLTLTST